MVALLISKSQAETSPASPGGVPEGAECWAQGGKSCFPVVKEARCLVTKSLFFAESSEQEEAGWGWGWGGVAVKDGPFKENQEELVDVREQRQLQVPVPCPTFSM